MPESATPPAIVIADDHPLVCTALSYALRAAIRKCTVFTAGTLKQLETVIDTHPELDLALLDLHMPGTQGFSGLVWLRGHCPQLPVIVVSSDDHPRTVARAQQFGAAGFLSKSAPLPQMADGIQRVLAGDVCFTSHALQSDADDARLAAQLAQLTSQQMRVLMCIAEGMLNKQIAHELCLAENTVKVHVTAVLHKLGCRTRTHAALLVRRLEGERGSGDAPSG
jgi:DNA-binding NarL/FixJ family response regulator